MEYLKGSTLKEIIKKQGKLPEQLAVSYATHIAEALIEVHNAGILHRDIKPGNVVVTDDGRVVLIDFGSARGFAADQTKTMTSILTPGYAPIEQYSSKARFTPATDIYSLGATLYHMVTGRMPEPSTEQISGDTLTPPVKIDPTVSKEINGAIVWALNINATRRPQSAEAFVQAMHGAPTLSGWVFSRYLKIIR